MQQQHIGYRVKGFYRWAGYALRWDMLNPSARDRLKILTFFEKHGLAATIDAFGVSRRSLYRWQAAWRSGGGDPTALVPRSCAPTRRRRRSWLKEVSAEIQRLRQAHPNRGQGQAVPAPQRVLWGKGAPLSCRKHHRADYRGRPGSHAPATHAA